MSIIVLFMFMASVVTPVVVTLLSLPSVNVNPVMPNFPIGMVKKRATPIMTNTISNVARFWALLVNAIPLFSLSDGHLYYRVFKPYGVVFLYCAFTRLFMIDFETLLEEKPILFSDTAVNKEFGNWYRESVSGSQFMGEVDIGGLEKGIDSAKWFKWWFSQSPILTTTCVVQELNRFRKKLRLKLKKLQTKDQIYHTMHGRDYARKVELFKLVASLYREVCIAAREAVFRPLEPKKFSALEEVVLAVSENTDSKRDYTHRYEKDPGRKPDDLRADESLVAAALYVSLVDNEPCTIVSADSDIRRLLLTTCKLIANGEIPGGNDFYEALRKFHIRVYFSTKEGLKFDVDTQNLSFDRLFNANMDDVNKSRLRQRIMGALADGNLIERPEYFRV